MTYLPLYLSYVLDHHRQAPTATILLHDKSYSIAFAYLWRPFGTFLEELENFLCALFDGMDSKLFRLDKPFNLFERAALIHTRHLKVQPSIDCVIYTERTKPGNFLENKPNGIRVE